MESRKPTAKNVTDKTLVWKQESRREKAHPSHDPDFWTGFRSCIKEWRVEWKGKEPGWGGGREAGCEGELGHVRGSEASGLSVSFISQLLSAPSF